MKDLIKQNTDHKMEKKAKATLFWIGLGGTILITLLVIIIPIILLGGSFLWLWITLGFEVVIWIIVGVVFLILWFTRKKPVKLELDLEKAKERAIYEIAHDKDNPDNFKVEQTKLWKVGSPGKERTPIHVLMGKGTEKLNRRVVLVNGNNPEKEMTFLIDPTDEEIKENARLISDEPPELEYVYESGEMDFLGNMPRIIKRTRPSEKIEEKKEQQEEQKI